MKIDNEKKKENGETEKKKTLEKTSIMIYFSRITWCQKKRTRSHFGSSCGNACKAPSVPFFDFNSTRFMALDSAAALIHELHGRLLRHLAAQQQTHFEGLAVAARQLRKQEIGSSRTWRRLREIDVAYNFVRHITKELLEHADHMADTMTYTAPSPFVEFTAPAPDVTYTEPDPVIEIVAPASAVTYSASAPVFEYAAPAPVTGYIAPAPAVTSDAHSQQLPPVYTTTTATTDDNLDMTGLLYPQFSSTAVEPFSPHVVGPLPPLKEFAGPMYNQIHQEQIAAGETTENIAEIPVEEEQVIVQEIPEVVGPLPPIDEPTEPVYNQVHQEQLVASLQNIIHEKQMEVDRGVLVLKREKNKLRLLEECSLAPPRDLEELRRAIQAGQDALAVAMRELHAFREQFGLRQEASAERAAAELLSEEEVAAPKTMCLQ